MRRHPLKIWLGPALSLLLTAPIFLAVPLVLLATLAAADSALAADQLPPVDDAMVAAVRADLVAMVAADTSNPPGNEARITKLVAKRLQAAGIKFEELSFGPGRSDIVARLPAHGTPIAKPLLLIAHTDVVPATGQAWTSPPHSVTEKNGYLVGRGTADTLSLDAAWLELVLKLHAAHLPLRRDIILALTGDEESGGTGIRYLLDHHPELVNAGIALNEGGGPVTGEDGQVQYIALQTAEKTYQDFALTATGPTGHSSIPLPGNAIYRLAAALTKLSDLHMPDHLIPVTRSYFAVSAAFAKEPTASAMRKIAASQGALDPEAVAVVSRDWVQAANLHTTCVATLLSGGTKENALPPSARAVINCRILPDETVAVVEARLKAQLIGTDPALKLERITEYGVAGSSPVDAEVPLAVAAAGKDLWPQAPVIPTMSRGATDSRYLRLHGIDAYGLSSVPMQEADAQRAHGIDERIPVAGLKPGLVFLQDLVLRLAAE